MAILKANYQPRSRTGSLGRSVAYYSWRESADRPRTWHDQNGRELGYDAVQEAVAEHTAAAPYTYRLVLSTREAALDPADYAEVLGEEFACWYVTTHHAGSHPHAHAISFANELLDIGDLRAMRERLHGLELEHERQLDRGAAADWSP